MDAIKEVVGVSIGSSKRDHAVEVELFGEVFKIRREGTDGDMEKAAARLRELDGTVDAFGLGGIDLFLHAADRDFYFRDAKRFRAAVTKTPIVWTARGSRVRSKAQSLRTCARASDSISPARGCWSPLRWTAGAWRWASPTPAAT